MNARNDRNHASDDDLHRYVDGRLDPARVATVAAHLLDAPDDRARVEAWKSQNAGLHGVYDAVLEEEIPLRLRRATRPWRPIGRLATRVAAAAALFALGGVSGWTLHESRPMPESRIVIEFAERAAVAHAVYKPEVRHPVEVAASDAQHLAVWTSRRLGLAQTIVIPDLKSAGYELVGGRLLPDVHGPAAQYMYQDAAGRRVTLYVKNEGGTAAQPADDQQRFEAHRRGDTTVLAWRDGKLGCAIAGDIEKQELKRLAYIIYGYGQSETKTW